MSHSRFLVSLVPNPWWVFPRQEALSFLDFFPTSYQVSSLSVASQSPKQVLKFHLTHGWLALWYPLWLNACISRWNHTSAFTASSKVYFCANSCGKPVYFNWIRNAYIWRYFKSIQIAIRNHNPHVTGFPYEVTYFLISYTYRAWSNFYRYKKFSINESISNIVFWLVFISLYSL